MSATSGPTQDAIIRQIRDRVKAKITDAISGALSGADKVVIGLGLMHLDEEIDSGFILFAQENATRAFNVRFGAGSPNDFRSTGHCS